VEKDREKAGKGWVIPHPCCQLFEVHSSELKPDPLRDSGQASVIAVFLGFPVALCVVLAEFLLTTSLLFVHLKFLSGTRADTVPAVFAAVATVYGSGSTTRTPYCAAAVLIGIGMAYGTGWVVSHITSRLHKDGID